MICTTTKSDKPRFGYPNEIWISKFGFVWFGGFFFVYVLKKYMLFREHALFEIFFSGPEIFLIIKIYFGFFSGP
jgi:hypothetical protein